VKLKHNSKSCRTARCICFLSLAVDKIVHSFKVAFGIFAARHQRIRAFLFRVYLLDGDKPSRVVPVLDLLRTLRTVESVFASSESTGRETHIVTEKQKRDLPSLLDRLDSLAIGALTDPVLLCVLK
jgi:hypothetical protein